MVCYRGACFFCSVAAARDRGPNGTVRVGRAPVLVVEPALRQRAREPLPPAPAPRARVDVPPGDPREKTAGEPIISVFLCVVFFFTAFQTRLIYASPVTRCSRDL